MSRPDLLALDDTALEDLTSKGTLRRARKELEQTSFELTEADDGTVTSRASDDTVCVLFQDRPFADWTCTCLATHNCRHIVRAVLHYQARHRDAPAPTKPNSDDDTNAPAAPPSQGPRQTTPAFDPATVSRESLAAALTPAALRRANQLAAQGLLAHVGSVRGISVVRIHHPVPVAVRFLAGPDLNYVRCTCRDPDPCGHVPLAVAAAAGTELGATGLRSVTGDAWRPDAPLLDELRQAVSDLICMGAESGHRNLRGVWRRLASRARDAELHHVAGVLEDLLAELERYESRSHTFTPSRLVALSGELLARCTSLANPDPLRVPDRLVAGSPPQDIRVGKARLIGLGTEFVELDDECRLVAYMVDARSGAPLRVTKRVTDEHGTSSSRLANGLVAGIAIHSWGGGQVMSLGGRRFGHGDFSHTNRSAVGLPAGAVDQLEAPFQVETVAELATQQTRLPAVLDDRSVGSDLAACRATGIQGLRFDAPTACLVAELLDGAGQPFRLVLRHTLRRDGSVRATWARLGSWAETFPDKAFVAGRWRWGGHHAVVDPLLLVGDGVPFQPHIAEPVPLELDRGVEREGAALTSPGALLHELGLRLGELLVAGADRIQRHDGAWREFARRARQAGSQLVAGHAEGFLADRDPARIERLLLIMAFGHPLV
ncbi:MAG: hypothetical protein Q4D79_12980 [Propionibacteriaceae bacterium]|nr:hypothetical protein [Propionibacteriaceae bacterium]